VQRAILVVAAGLGLTCGVTTLGCWAKFCEK
jgi:hypothetical protein